MDFIGHTLQFKAFAEVKTIPLDIHDLQIRYNTVEKYLNKRIIIRKKVCSVFGGNASDDLNSSKQQHICLNYLFITNFYFSLL